MLWQSKFTTAGANRKSFKEWLELSQVFQYLENMSY